MGASDSKLVFKQGIFRLSEERHIPADDVYWTSFWQLPESSEDVFSLFSPADIRRTRDRALENLETLILAATSRLFYLRHHPSFPETEMAPERDALNCIRVLTRILPYLYEKESLASWEERFFWGTRRIRTRKATVANEVLFDESQDKPESPADQEQFEDAKPLAEELIDTLLDLLFFSGLTLPSSQGGKSKVTYAIWQSGVGCNSTVATTKEYESNRCEILRLLMTLAGQSMYMTQATLPQTGVRALTYLCTCPDKQVVLSVLCSLLNTTLKYNPATWRVPYNSLVFKDTKQLLITQSLHFMLALLLYPIPETADTAVSKNYYRHYLGRVHRPQDFQFIVDGMTRILSQPLQEKSSYLPGSQQSEDFSPEIIMLFWEITQCNKRFRSFIIDTGCAHDLIIMALFYALEYRNEPAKHGVVRMCVFLLQTLSVETAFGVNLNKAFDGQNTLPPSIRINGFRGTYADYLIQSIFTLITTSQGKLSAIYPALLAIINNIAPHVEHLSLSSSSRLMQLFSSMSSPAFLLTNETNHTLLHSLLDSINSIMENKYRKNPALVCAVIKNKKRIEALREFTLESGKEEIERRRRLRKDSTGHIDPFDAASLRSSSDSVRSPSIAPSRMPPLEDVPEDGAFAIGDDEEEEEEESDEEYEPTPVQSTTSENASQESSATAAEDAVPTQLRGMSEKARGKMPAGVRSFSRQNSSTSLGGYSMSGQSQPGGAFDPSSEWIETWLPELPLHTILTVIQQVSVILPPKALSQEPIAKDTLRLIEEREIVGIDPSPVRVHSFEWSQLALGWYESLLWGAVFTSEMQIAKGNMGVWNGTSIKLFRVQETTPTGPTLTSPRGAVDAVGSNIISRIGQINLRGGQQGAGSTSPTTAAPTTNNTTSAQ